MSGVGPPTGALTLELAGEPLWLLPERAIWWPGGGMLLLADTHLGKGASFRRAGMAVPTGSSAQTLARLGGLVEQLAPRQIMILGDVLHAALPREDPLPAMIARWRERYPGPALRAVRGNHDRTPEPLAGLLEWHAERLPVAPFVLRHHPCPDPEGPVLAGHLHPAVRLQGPARDTLRLPAFVLEGGVLTLPAFGELTGGRLVGPGRDRRRYAATPDRVVALDS